MKAVFLDRDGVINPLIRRPDDSLTSPFSFDEFDILPGVKSAINMFRVLGYKIFVVTNQPHLGQELPYMELMKINGWMQHQLGLDGISFCSEKHSYRYKPNSAMIDEFITHWGIDPFSSWTIGDRWKDIVAGRAAGTKTIFVGREYEVPDEYAHVKYDCRCDTLLKAAEYILQYDNEPVKIGLKHVV